MKKSQRFKVLNSVNYSGCKKALDVFDSIADVHTVEPNYKSISNIIKNYDAYISSLDVMIDETLLLKAKKLKVIGSPSTGTDHLDLKFASKIGIKCFSIAKEYKLINSFTATSELAFGLLLMLNRNLISAIDSANKGEWAREKYSGFQLNGKTFGILGLGRLGKISARIAKGFNMNVIAHDIKDMDGEGIKMVKFKELFKLSDVLSIHIHLNEKNFGLINKKCFDLMKKTSILINTSRGGLINEQDLIDTLRNKKIKGAVLDIIYGEWNNNIKNHPLIKYARNNSNLLISPHIGGATTESINNARIFMAKKVARYLEKLKK